MSFQLFGLPVSRGIAIGRAVLVASSRLDVAHYYVAAADVEAEIERLRSARDAVAAELAAMQRDLPIEAPAELSALLDVHLMLLHDDTLTGATKQWIRERHYNAEWALSAQLEVLARQFDEMEDEYLRERKADLEQVVERLLGVLARGEDGASPLASHCRLARAERRGPARPRCGRHLARPTCCASRAACSSASSPTSAARPRTPRSSRAAWTSRRSSARARRAG
jgi:signal transduction protein with GAF and PtsI domain